MGERTGITYSGTSPKGRPAEAFRCTEHDGACGRPGAVVELHRGEFHGITFCAEHDPRPAGETGEPQ